MSVIVNTTVLSNFAAVGQLALLRRRFGTLFLSDAVFEETQAGFMQGYEFYESLMQIVAPFSSDGWLYLTALHDPEEFRLYGQLLGNLHSGEASSLAIACCRHWIFLTDDKSARTRSRALQVSISGTSGILASLIQRSICSLEEGDWEFDRGATLRGGAASRPRVVERARVGDGTGYTGNGSN